MSLNVRMRFILVALFALPSIVLALFGWMFSRAVVGALAARDEDSWMKVPAKILKVDYEIYHSGRTGGVEKSCKYRYAIDGVLYEGLRISPSMLSSEEGNEIIGCLREGDVVDIWVNLHDHSYAALSRRVGIVPLMVFGLGSFLGLIAIVVMVWHRRSLIEALTMML